MNNKKKSQDLGLGDFIVPIIDLISIIITKGIDEVSRCFGGLIGKYILNNSDENIVNKIERDNLYSNKATLNDKALGYSLTQSKDLNLSEIDKTKHSIIVGASGFGKTVLLDALIFDDMKMDKAVIFIDPKGDNKTLNQFINLAKIAGREFLIFSENYNGSNKIDLNPVKTGSFTQIADRIHYSFDWSEEHYETLCYRALKRSIKELKELQENICFQSILNKLIELTTTYENHKEFKRSDIDGLIARLENIIDSDFGEMLNFDGKSITELWDTKECVYIGMPVLGYPKIARGLGKILLGDLSYSVYQKYTKINVENAEGLYPIGVYIDELSAFITDEIIELVNKSRGAKMELTMAIQSPSDINKISNHLCEQILENAANWFILKQRMEVGANLFANSIGTTEGKKKTVRVVDGEEQDQGSQRLVEELVVHANLIKNLNQGQCILLRHSPTKVDLVNIKYLNERTIYENVKFLERNQLINKVDKVTSINELGPENDAGGIL